MTQFNISKGDDFTGAVVYLESGDAHTVPSTHPEWEAIRAHLLSDNEDESALLDLILPAKGVATALSALSERVSYSAGIIYFDGDVIHGALIDHIIRIIEGGSEAKAQGYQPFVNFLEKLYTNPSAESIEHLYSFIENNRVTILPDGDFLAYKGVRDDGTSQHAGYGIVNGVIFEKANLLNEVGSVIEIPRSMVDADRGVGCSVGLHVGSYAYASNFARRLLTAKVNPRDVVSVPSDCTFQKIRVARYTVLAVADGEVKTPTFTPPVAEKPAPEPEPVKPESAPVAATDSKVDTFKALIQNVLVPDGVNLRRYRNKRITQARRGDFDKALAALGL